MKIILTSALLTSVILLSACDSKWQKLADDQLAAKSSDCAAIGDPSSAMIQVCKNVARECERRRENGVYAC
ncbi:hypothetical protein [Dasania marina]|uniref:hypothetical protein n=1 Tax=Dasania marina TaxID=471499 RepID=UPI0030D920D9|tara:strand:- start:9800 stop:10012 length:213 start_codon:yes stop_codon:yes gene_type:complete